MVLVNMHRQVVFRLLPQPDCFRPPLIFVALAQRTRFRAVIHTLWLVLACFLRIAKPSGS